VLKRLWTHRTLVLTLVRRQYQLRYRQSFAGFGWALIPPLATLGVGAILFGQVVDVKFGGQPYLVAAAAGIVPWTFFANSVTQGVPSIVGSLPMVTRLPFPRAVLPLSMVGLSFVDLAVASAAFIPLAYVLGDGLAVTALWSLPLLALEIPLVIGVALLGAALNVFARDIRLAVPLLVQLLLFLTPVMYPLSRVPEHLQGAYLLNPMTGIVESFRRVLVFGQPPTMRHLLPAIVGTAILFVVGLWYFRATEPRFADAV
jgi:lipopolysaccharide transport system permease protein